MLYEKMNPEGEMEKLIWKEIIDYEGYYSISQFGDVKSHDREVVTSRGIRMYRGRMRKLIKSTRPYRDNQVRYSIGLLRDNHRSGYSILRLMAEAFLGISKDDPDFRIVPIDSNYSNLYWKNLMAVPTDEFVAERMNELHRPVSIAVYCRDSDGTVTEFESITAAQEVTGIVLATIAQRIRTKKEVDGRTWYKCDPRDVRARYLDLREFEPNEYDLIIGELVNASSERPIWKDIRGFEGVYAVNQFGQVKRLARTVRTGTRGLSRVVPERLLNVHYSRSSKGVASLMVYLGNSYSESRKHLSRLVANAFLEVDKKDSSRPIIAKDGSFTNLHPDNLIVDKYFGCVSVICVNDEGDRHHFAKITMAAKKFGVSTRTIRRWLMKPDRYFRGWKWTYNNEDKQGS